MSGASIETRHGFEPFEEPVGTPGVDRACLGPGDLSFVETAEPWVSLGTLILATHRRMRLHSQICRALDP